MTLKDLITKEESKLFELLHLRRHEFDYDDFVSISEAEIKALFENCERLVNKIESLIYQRQ